MPDRATLIAMCEAHDREEAAQRGEPSPWREDGIPPFWIEERVGAMAEAVRAWNRRPAATEPVVKGLTIRALQLAHAERQEEWCPEQKPDLSFRGNEMAGEVGEACNVIKKLERERQGWAGSRANPEQLGEELADVIHTAVLCAISAGIDLEPAVVAKFNATSEKVGLRTRILSALETPPSGGSASEAEKRERLEAERDHIQKLLTDRLSVQKARAEASSARVAELEAALAPFEDISGDGDEDLPDDTPVHLAFGRTDCFLLTLGDFRRARQALGGVS